MNDRKKQLKDAKKALRIAKATVDRIEKHISEENRGFIIDNVAFRLYKGEDGKLEECLQIYGGNQYSYIRGKKIKDAIIGLRRLHAEWVRKQKLRGESK